MSDGLKVANRLRLDLAIEIQQLASGARRITHVTPDGPVDMTEHTLTVLRDRFEQIEMLIAACRFETRLEVGASVRI